MHWGTQATAMQPCLKYNWIHMKPLTYMQQYKLIAGSAGWTCARRMQADSRAPDLELSTEDLEGAMEQLEKAVAAHSPGILHMPVLVLASTRRDLTRALLQRLVQERGSVFEALPMSSGTPDAATQARVGMLCILAFDRRLCTTSCVLMQAEAASSLDRHAHNVLRRNKVCWQVYRYVACECDYLQHC